MMSIILTEAAPVDVESLQTWAIVELAAHRP